MTKQILTITAALLVAAATVHAQDVDNPVAVFVTAAAPRPMDTRTPEQRKAAATEAEKALKTLERSLKQQFGKKRENWPADQRDKQLSAEEAASLARVDLYYGDGDSAVQSVSDAVGDIQRALDGVGMAVRQKHVRQVTSADEAQLVVEIRARRVVEGTGLLLAKRLSTNYFVLFSVKAGPKMTAEQFAALSRAFKGAGVARPRADAPEWLFESVGTGSWKAAGAMASATIDALAKANLAALAGTTDAR